MKSRSENQAFVQSLYEIVGTDPLYEIKEIKDVEGKIIGRENIFKEKSKSKIKEAKEKLADYGNINEKDEEGMTLLLHALSKGYNEVAIFLIMETKVDRGVMDDQEMTVLHHAAKGGCSTELIMRYFPLQMDRLSNLDNNGKTAFQYAVENNHVDAAIGLIKSGVDLNEYDKKNMSPFLYALRGGNKELLDFLSEEQMGNINLEQKGRRGLTPLHKAAQNKWVVGLEFLLEKGAIIETLDKYGDNALLLASRESYTDVIKLLLDKGANPRKVDKYGNTPLHWALQTDNVKIVELLLDKGVSPNVLDKNGDTPLTWTLVSYTKNIKIAELLLDKGANPNILDKNGNTPLYLALKLGNEEMINLLVKYKATLTWSEALEYPNFSAKNYARSSAQQMGNYLSETIFPSTSVQLLLERDNDTLNSSTPSPHTKREEKRSSDAKEEKSQRSGSSR